MTKMMITNSKDKNINSTFNRGKYTIKYLYEMKVQTNDRPTGRSNISIPPSHNASDAHDIAAASARIHQ